MAIVSADKSSIETIIQMIRDGIVYRDIAKYTKASVTEISVIARVSGLGRKRGPKPGTKYRPRKPKADAHKDNV